MLRATRQDVAQLAGVSTAVVSYVLNDGPRPVAEATRQRVLAAMEQLSYRPNALARALKSERTYVLGLMIADITNPYYSEFARAFQDQARDAGWTVMIASGNQDSERETEDVKSFLAREVDGIAVYGARGDETLDVLASSGTRVVSVHFDREELPSVAVDDYSATRTAIEHLQAHGHIRIGFLGGLGDFTQRDLAWRDALSPDLAADDLLAWGEFSRQGGYDAMIDLLSRTNPPTAVFVSSDYQAFGALRAAEVLGVRVPEDLAIVSYDGTSGSAFTSPPLTAIRIPFDLIARQCLRKLTAAPASFELHTTVPHELVLRDSCGCGETETGRGRPIRARD